MPKYAVKIEIEAVNPEKVKEVGNLIQNMVNVVEQKDVIKLLGEVKKNPSIVKKALMFL